MAKIIPELIQFDLGDPNAVVAELDSLLAERTGGWMNIGPDLDEEVASALTPSPVGRLFSARGPAVPLATVVAPDHTGRRTSGGSVGLEHHGGPKSAIRLAQAGVEVPEGLVKRQDHSRRGLVYEFTETPGGASVVAFVVAAARELTAFELGTSWLAATHRPRGA